MQSGSHFKSDYHFVTRKRLPFGKLSPMPNSPIFSYTFSVPQNAIDDYGHVNNVIYVQWMQDAAIRHGEATPGYKLAENTGWFAREHRIEYLAPAFVDEEIEVRTWLAEAKRSRAHRRYEFIRRADGKLIAKGETQWIHVDLTTGRPIQIPATVMELVQLLPDTPAS